MEYKSATVRLDEVEIKKAIDDYVAAQGYAVLKVTLDASPHQHNGPDTFSASVEVRPAETGTGDVSRARRPWRVTD